MTAVNINRLERGCTNSGRQVVVASNNLVFVVVQISCHVSEAFNFETAQRFFEKIVHP